MGYIFNLNEKVEIMNVPTGHNENLVGVKGIIRDVAVDSNGNTVYGLKLIEGTENYDIKWMEDFLLYFLAKELELR